MNEETVMKHVALLLMTTAALAACSHTDSRRTPSRPPVVSGPTGPVRPPMPLDTVPPALQMCEVQTLAEQRLAMLEEIHGYRETIGVQTRTEAVADTEVQELVAAFETDLDASYRFATSSCRTYNRCLEVNRFNEESCQDTASLWHDSQDRFHDLSERLALVRERIASGCTTCGPRSHGHARREDAHAERRRHRHDNDDLMGSVFSTSEDH